jgi:ATP-dependent helicase/nuclease subunit A
MRQPTLFETEEPPNERAAPPSAPDQAARDFAVDPSHHVVLEASAGTGKTRVLVERYVRLIGSGVDPRHILAITFTRKAAAEMRDRVLAELLHRAETGALEAEQWASIRNRLTRIEIATIDAFCFSLLREFPLEADVDPGFDIADETEMGRFTSEALDLTFRIARPLITTDEHLRLLFTRVKQPILRDALATLLDRRHVAVPAVETFVGQHAGIGNVTDVCSRFVERVREVLSGADVLDTLVTDGPAGAPEFGPVATDLQRVMTVEPADHARVRALRTRLERYFLTRDGKPRQRLSRPYLPAHFASSAARQRHERVLSAVAPHLKVAFDRLDRDLDVILARGLRRLLGLLVAQYDRLLEEHALLDFAGMLDRAVALLERQEEFARSRLKLQSRYHHLLIDEFQDTSRRQWRLVELLIEAWAEGEGSADAPTSVFIVGDRKQSIYRFRHAEAALFDEAATRIGLLRPNGDVRRAITTSYRSVPELLAFVNALGSGLQGDASLPDRWRYDSLDRFPVPAVSDGARRDGSPVLGIVTATSIQDAASAVAGQIARLVAAGLVRDRHGAPRPVKPDDIVVLFRTRAGHRVFEEALDAHGLRTYVYKGLGFFDSPEVQDLHAVVRYLAQPHSTLRMAELLRSRVARLSDEGLTRVMSYGPRALLDADFDVSVLEIGPTDAAVVHELRRHVPRWLVCSTELPPSEIVDVVLRESAYAAELSGRRLDQARENVKKVRSLIRRVENRGYTTLARLATYFETLKLGDDSNALIEAGGAVNLMTIHAAKGLEFPIVFVVNMHMAGRGRSAAVSVIDRGPRGEPVVAFGSSEATKLEDAREAEELRRLLYVAVTRARDQLYLAAEVDAKGEMKGGSRSLAGLLPPTLATTFVKAAGASSDQSVVRWHTEDGTFDFAICRPSAPQPAGSLVASPRAESVWRPIPPWSSSDRQVRAASAGLMREVRPAVEAGLGSGRMIGTLVHRFLAAAVDPETQDATGMADRFLTSDERVDIPDLEQIGREALTRYRRLRSDAALLELFAAGQALFEVPFSVVAPDQPGECLRGVIDCLVVTADRATVVEIKTGRPRAEHEQQVELYRRAAVQICPGRAIDVRLLYLGD